MARSYLARQNVGRVSMALRPNVDAATSCQPQMRRVKSKRLALPREIPIKLSEISNLFKEEQSGSRDAVDVDWTKT
jgi:threonyl-tRNA synthetase